MKQIALITGSSRGIGKEIARELIASGFQVVLHASKMSNELNSTELEFKKLDPKTRSVVFDVSDGPLVEKSCKDLLASIGRVDVLINNAGIARDKTLLNMPGFILRSATVIPRVNSPFVSILMLQV